MAPVKSLRGAAANSDEEESVAARVACRFGAALPLVAIMAGLLAVGIGTRSNEASRSARACAPLAAADQDWPVARRWDGALLDAIRRALPNQRQVHFA